MTPQEIEANVVMVPIAGCWLWNKGLAKLGYGITRVNGKVRNAHRVSYEVHCGHIPHGMCVLHRCDQPACVNPHHLRLGTMADNTRDMMAKGRDRFTGMRNPGCKLTDEQVALIRLNTESSVKAARLYGVARSTITAIRRGESRRSH